MTNTNRNSDRTTRAARGKKRYRIKSPIRFITSMVIIIGLIVGIGSAVMGLNDSVALTKHETVSEYVDAGETLWSIAKEYKSEKTDTREAVYEICKINNIKADDLQVGMIIQIPDNI
ncbi:MAG: LysM peptidoglycan-binding domain-containing protein [Eubacterium sp.]|nr:LysM peptidoglycan-binding domain-containing protein [Candidatus Colimonas fimequi]